VLGTLARRSEVPYFFGTFQKASTPNASIANEVTFDFESALSDLLFEYGTRVDGSFSERLAAVTALSSYEGRQGGGISFIKAKRALLRERLNAKNLKERERAEKLLVALTRGGA
jgi:hypothetical protein